MNISNKDLKLLLKSSSAIYNTLCVLNDYCYHMQEYETIMNLHPIVEYLHNESDKLYFNLSSIKERSIERAK